MRIFTLRKNGIPFFFFALLLFSGTTMYGQNCPTVSDTTQDFCYLSTVADLEATANGDDVRWYRSETGTTPIPENELLQDGTYYAGNESGTCATRVVVNVDVTTLPAPASSFGSVFSPPIHSTGDVYEIQDLTNVIEPTDPSYEIVVYQTEYGTATYAPSDVLVDGQSYFIGQTEPGNPCYSLRTAMRYSPDLIEAPTVSQDPQVFCGEPTVADLVANGTSENTQAILWYSTATSSPALDDTDLLVDGEIYYASQIINNEGDPFPPTESEDRVAVTVVIDPGPDAGAANTGTLCETEVQSTFPDLPAITDYYLNLLDEGVPTDGTFSPSVQEIAQQYQNDPDGLGDFTTTYTIGTGDCQDSVDLTVSITEAIEANAGTGQTVSYCIGEGEINLYNLLSPEANSNGVFETGYEDGTFNPSEEGVGTYEITYTVGDEIPCVIGTASATFTINVNEGNANAGTDQTATVCETDVQATFPDFPAIRNYYLNLLDEGVPTDGTFSPTAEELSQQYQNDPDGLGDFTTTYTVGDGECEDSVELTVTITEATPATVGGDIADFAVCSVDGGIDLFSYLSDTNTPGGTFADASGGEITDGIFMETENGEYELTYTVDETDPGTCLTGTASTNFTVTVGEGTANAGEDTDLTFCQSEIDEIIQLVITDPDAARAMLAERIGDDVDTNGTFSDDSLEEIAAQYTLAVQAGAFPFTAETTYTVGEGECQDSSELSITVTENQTATTGDIADFSVCNAEDGIDLFFYLSDENTLGGTFTDDSGDEIPDGNLTVTETGDYAITYTVTEDDPETCLTGTASTDFIVTVTEGNANAGTDQTATVCESEVPTMFPDYPSITNYYLDLLDEGVSRDGTFSKTAEELSEEYQNNPDKEDFTTIYTVGNGDCTDSVELTVTVLDSKDAGENATVNLTEDELDPVDLFEALNGTPDEGGTWTDENGNVVDATFDPTTETEGDFTYTVSSGNGCEDFATVTVIIGEVEVNCPEITNPEQTFCPSNPTVADLLPADAVWFASADATEALDATTELVDGAEYFAGNADGTCEARGTVTVTITQTPAAPEVTDVTFCAVEAATIANLDDTGNIQYYTDEALTEPAEETDILVDGVYYATTTTEGGCESEAAMLTVTLNDGPAPTIGQEGNVFCELDNPTIANLEEKIVESGTLTFYDAATGGNVLNSSDALQNGTTYYVALEDAETGCESSERLAVPVTLETCEIMIPEAFSPNGDEINDRFEIDGLAAEYPNYTIEIYNRWGDKVYQGNASTSAWDGVSTASGALSDGKVPTGVYFYILNYNDGQTAPTQGRLYLSR